MQPQLRTVLHAEFVRRMPELRAVSHRRAADAQELLGDHQGALDHLLAAGDDIGWSHVGDRCAAHLLTARTRRPPQHHALPPPGASPHNVADALGVVFVHMYAARFDDTTAALGRIDPDTMEPSPELRGRYAYARHVLAYASGDILGAARFRRRRAAIVPTDR